MTLQQKKKANENLLDLSKCHQHKINVIYISLSRLFVGYGLDSNEKFHSRTKYIQRNDIYSSEKRKKKKIFFGSFSFPILFIFFALVSIKPIQKLVRALIFFFEK